jgi:hypothetical protein
MTDFRALCAALVDEAPYESPITCLARAALLAQPEPVAPSNKKVVELVAWLRDRANSTSLAHTAHRILLAADLLERLSQPEPAAPTDEEIAQFVTEWWGNMHGFAPHEDKTVYTVFEFVAREHFADFTRDVLARWGTPANSTGGTH